MYTSKLATRIVKSELFQGYLNHLRLMQELRKRFFIPGNPDQFWSMDIRRDVLHDQILREHGGSPGDAVDATLQSLVFESFNQGD